MRAKGGQYLFEEDDLEEVENHPLLVWASIRLGDVVSLHVQGNREYAGKVESGTSDGLIIWTRESLNERRLFHFRDCESACLMS